MPSPRRPRCASAPKRRHQRDRSRRNITLLFGPRSPKTRVRTTFDIEQPDRLSCLLGREHKYPRAKGADRYSSITRSRLTHATSRARASSPNVIGFLVMSSMRPRLTILASLRIEPSPIASSETFDTRCRGPHHDTRRRSRRRGAPRPSHCRWCASCCEASFSRATSTTMNKGLTQASPLKR